MPLATSENSATSVHPWAAAKARTLRFQPEPVLALFDGRYPVKPEAGALGTKPGTHQPASAVR